MSICLKINHLNQIICSTFILVYYRNIELSHKILSNPEWRKISGVTLHKIDKGIDTELY